jgi:tellurite resistance protein
VTTSIHCSTCGQDLPEPQRRLAEAAIAQAQANAEATSAWLRGQLDRDRLRDTWQAVRCRSDLHDVDDVWVLRNHEAARMNRERRAEFNLRATLYGKTVPMVRTAEDPIARALARRGIADPHAYLDSLEAAPVTDGALGTFHHPV